MVDSIFAAAACLEHDDSIREDGQIEQQEARRARTDNADFVYA